MEDKAINERDTARLLATVATLTIVLAQLGGNDSRAEAPQEEQSCLALALYWEARSEGRRGMIAVGWTILNRVRNRDFPSTPCTVVHQGGEQPPCQFSWWCDGRSDRPRDQQSWRMAQRIASELLLDPPPDPTDGSLFFHTTNVKPAWTRSRIKTAEIGTHAFYR